MNINGTNQWENIYSSRTKDAVQINNKHNLEFYRSISEDEYETLDKCADFWIKNRSHAAFVHFFIEKGMFPDELFKDCLGKHVDKFQEDYKCTISWIDLRVMKKEYWLSPDIEADKLMDEKYCYKKDYVSRFCKIDKRKYKKRKYKKGLEQCNKEKTKEKKKKRKKSVKAYNVPEREIIIQLGIYLKLSSDDVNSLFRAAGLPQFYTVDVVDVVSMYCLNKYHDEKIINSETWQEDGEKRIIETKKRINQVLHIMLDEVNDGNKNHENLRSKMYTVEIKKEKKKEEKKEEDIPPYRKIVYQHSLCNTVDEEIQKFIELEKNEEIESVEGNTFYITKKIEELYKENKNKDFEIFKNQVILQKSKDSRYVSAIEYRYGYIRKIKDVLKKAIEKGNYIKNFENIDWEFDIKKPWNYEKSEGIKESGYHKKTVELKTNLLEIWYCKDFIQSGPEESIIEYPGSGFCVDNYIRHRTVKIKTEKNDKKIERVKIPQTMSKCTLTKFVISMGIEDKREIYLDSVNYGVERKLYKECENDIKDEEKSRDNSYPVDRGDMLFEYVCILRDKLIEDYVNNSEKDSNILRGNLKNSFPFAKMMNYVTRDIQYVLGFIIVQEETEEREEIIRKEKELVLQEDRLTNPKNSGYCLCFPYSFDSDPIILYILEKHRESVGILEIDNGILENLKKKLRCRNIS